MLRPTKACGAACCACSATSSHKQPASAENGNPRPCAGGFSFRRCGGHVGNGGLDCPRHVLVGRKDSRRVMKRGSRTINATQLAAAFGQATALHQAGRLPEAEQIYRQILQSQPKHFESHFLLGVIYGQRGSHADAVRQFDVALKLNAKNAAVHNSRGVALGKLKRVTEALASFDRAIALQPNNAEAHSNRANALRELDRPEEALTSGNRAIALKPEYAEALNNRANVLLRLKRYEEAAGDLERVLRINPEFPYAKGMLLHTRMQLCDWRAFDSQIAAVIADVRAGKPASTPFALLAESGAARDQLMCAETW